MINNRKCVGDRTLRNTADGKFRRKTMTVYYSNNRSDGKETWDKGTVTKIKEKRMRVIWILKIW